MKFSLVSFGSVIVFSLFRSPHLLTLPVHSRSKQNDVRETVSFAPWNQCNRIQLHMIGFSLALQLVKIYNMYNFDALFFSLTSLCYICIFVWHRYLVNVAFYELRNDIMSQAYVHLFVRFWTRSILTEINYNQIEMMTKTSFDEKKKFNKSASGEKKPCVMYQCDKWF